MAKSESGDLIKYLESEFGDIKKRLGLVEESLDTLHTSVDAYAKKADTFIIRLV